MKKVMKAMLAAAAVAMISAQPAIAASSSPAQRLSLANADSVRAATPTTKYSRQMDTVPVWAIVLGVAVLGTGIYFLVKGKKKADSN